MTSAAPPALEPDPAASLYASTTVDTVINIRPDDFFDWYLFEPIEDFMLGTLIVPPITSTEPLHRPEWGKPGSSWKVFFRNGPTSMERILSTDLPRS